MFNLFKNFFREPENQVNRNKRIKDLENSFEKCVFSFIEREKDFIEIFSKYIDKKILKSIATEIKRPLDYWEADYFLETTQKDIDCCFYRLIYNSDFYDYNTVEFLTVLKEINIFLSKFGFNINFSKQREQNYVVFYNNKFSEIIAEKLVKND